DIIDCILNLTSNVRNDRLHQQLAVRPSSWKFLDFRHVSPATRNYQRDAKRHRQYKLRHYSPLSIIPVLQFPQRNDGRVATHCSQPESAGLMGNFSSCVAKATQPVSAARNQPGHFRVFVSPNNSKNSRRLKQPDRRDVVATVGDTAGECIVGRAVAEREEPTRMQHNAYANVNVLRSHWGRGIGRQLATAIDAWAREQNLRRLTGFVLAHNTRALRFALAAGFREEVLSPCYAVIDGRAVDRVRVVKSF